MPNPHWQYFFAIESDLENKGRRSPPINFLTYSIEFARILLSASSEVERRFQACMRRKSKQIYKTIGYQECILSSRPLFTNFQVGRIDLSQSMIPIRQATLNLDHPLFLFCESL
jgi:hypothetical protein